MKTLQLSEPAHFDLGLSVSASADDPPFPIQAFPDGGDYPRTAVIAYLARYHPRLAYSRPIPVLLKEYLPIARPVACNELLLLKHLCGLPEDKYAAVRDSARQHESEKVREGSRKDKLRCCYFCGVHGHGHNLYFLKIVPSDYFVTYTVFPYSRPLPQAPTAMPLWCRCSVTSPAPPRTRLQRLRRTTPLTRSGWSTSGKGSGR